MKKLLLIAALFLSNCQAIKKTIEDFQVDRSVVMEESTTHDQFESRDLGLFDIEKKRVKVALLLPFSGKAQDLGWSLFNAATLSLFENDSDDILELVLFDSSDPKEAMDKIAKQNIKVVIGPVFSSNVEEVASRAKKHDITVISLSNNQDLVGETNDNGGVVIAGMLPETQIDRIVGYAMSRDKMAFSVIAPNNQYGKVITELTKRMVRNRDGELISAEFYNNSQKDIDHAVANLIKVFKVSGHLMEGKNKLKKDAVISDDDRIYAQVIMIPESGKNLSRIVASIRRQNRDERDFQIIGTSEWDDVATTNDFNLLGAWFAAPENDKFREFERSYYRSFNKFPPRLASIVYDAVDMIVEIADNKDEDEQITLQDFTNFNDQQGFVGIDGPFRILPNGLVQRNLAILQVGNAKFDTLEKASDEFLKY